MDRDDRSRLTVALGVGACVVAVLVVFIVIASRMSTPPVAVKPEQFPFGPAEQNYAKQLHFVGGPMSQSTNMLHQEFTYASGTMTNSGTRTITGLQVVFEFRDSSSHVLLSDPQTLVEKTDPPLEAAQTHDFAITLGSNLPSDWNQQYPAIRVTGLILK